MALLGNVDTVERNLRATPNSGLNADAAGRLADIQQAVTTYIEERTGRTFGTVGVSESLVAEAASKETILGALGYSTILMLPKAIRTITSVVASPDWNGTAWIDGTTIEATDYRPVMFTKTGEAMALELTSGGYWSGMFVVTGTYEDGDADAVVPDDITYVANLLIGELFKYEQSSAAAVAGPEGQVLPLKNATKHPVVCAILDKYRTAESLVI